MSTCLITVLDGIVSDSKLKAPGELKIKVTKQDTLLEGRNWFNLRVSKAQTITILSDANDAYFMDNLGTNLGKTISFTENQTIQVFCSNANYEISIPDKYSIISLTTLNYPAVKSNFFTIDTEDMKYLTNLTTLQFQANNIKGKLEDIAKTDTNLMDLNLCYTNVEGDIKDLKDCTNLTNLRLFNNNGIYGDIDVLKHFPNLLLAQFNADIGIYGDIAVLANCPSLQYFAGPVIYGFNNLEGNISVASSLPNLTYFAVQEDLGITGNISAFSTNTSNLWYLNIGRTSVTGSINSLAPCNRLEGLYVYNNSNLTGDVSVFAVGKNLLREINISQCPNIGGDITNINLPSLNVFNAASSGIEGAINFLSNSPAIHTINVSNSGSVTGTLEVFENTTALRYLNIYNTGITGNVSSLAERTGLTVLSIGMTAVSGNIGSALADCALLKEVYCAFCPNLTGDLSLLNPYTIYFQGNLVTGEFSWENTRPSSAPVLAIAGPVRMGDYVDAMLINQANCQASHNITNSNYLTINVYGNRTSASDAAVRTLMQKGYIIYINGVLLTEASLGTETAGD